LRKIAHFWIGNRAVSKIKPRMTINRFHPEMALYRHSPTASGQIGVSRAVNRLTGSTD
jgi:hypothetical protein